MNKLLLKFILIVLALVPTLWLSKITYDNSPQVYLPYDSTIRHLEEELRKDFPTDKLFFIVLANKPIHSQEFVADVEAFVEAVEGQELVDRVMYFKSYQKIDRDADGMVMRYLFEEEEALDEGVQILSQDRFSKQLLIAKNRDSLSVVVKLNSESTTTRQLYNFETQLKDLISKYNLSEKVKAWSGTVPLEIAQLKFMFKDFAYFVPITFAVGLALIWWMFRSFLFVYFSGLLVILLVGWLSAGVVILGFPYNLATSVLPPLMEALMIAMIIHLYSSVRNESLKGKIGREALLSALNKITVPMFVTALTTAVGFFALCFNDVPAIQNFGLLAGCGIFIGYLLVRYLLPFMLKAYDFPFSFSKKLSSTQYIDKLIARLSHFSIRYAVGVVWLNTFLLAICIPFIYKITQETDLFKSFKPDHSISLSTEIIERDYVGVTTFDIVFTSDVPQAFKKLEYAEQISNLQDWLAIQPEVDRAVSPVDYYKELNWAFGGGDSRSLPESERLLDQYLLVYDGDSLYDYVSRDFSRARINVNANIHGSSKIEALFDKIRQRVAKMQNKPKRWFFAGAGAKFVELQDHLVGGQIKSLSWAVLTIFIVLVVLWRSLLSGIVCLIPNVAPLIIMFLIMGVVDIPLSMTTTMIASLAVGIAVDDTIHIFYSCRAHMMTSRNPVWAMARAYAHAGRAVVATTVILVAQLGSLMVSDFKPTSEFGMLTSIGLVAALFFDLTFLPALFITLYKVRRWLTDKFLGNVLTKVTRG